MRRPTTRSIEARAGAAVAAAALLAGCGTATRDAPGRGGTTTAAATMATAGAGAADVPAAQLSWPGGRVAMASHGGCWRASQAGPVVCADPAPPVCPDPAGRIPRVRVPVGTVLRFALRVPVPVELRLEGDHGVTTPLPPRRRVDWTAAAPSGPLILRARVDGRGDPAWIVCLELG